MPKWGAMVESSSISDLKPEFAASIRKLIEKCRTRGLNVVPFSTVRGPGAQARRWCRSRTWKEASEQAKLLVNCGAPTLASLLREEWCLKGRQETRLLPGQSWHQWGEAVDFMIQIDGRSVWFGSGYKKLADEAQLLGLSPRFSNTFERDPEHIQLRSCEVMIMDGGISWPELESQMLSRFDFEDLQRAIT